MKRRAFLARLAALSAALPLAGCGFQLRGTHAIPYRSIFLDGSKDATFESYDGGMSARRKESIIPYLSEALREQGVLIAESPKEADATLHIRQEKFTRTILSLSGSGRVREFRLNYSVTYSLTGKDGKEIYPDSIIRSTRDFTYDDNQYLAKTAEEAFLQRDQLDVAVQQITRRLSAQK